MASAGGGGGDINQTRVITRLASRPLHSLHPNMAALGESDLRLSPTTLLGEKLFVKWETTQAEKTHSALAAFLRHPSFIADVF